MSAWDEQFARAGTEGLALYTQLLDRSTRSCLTLRRLRNDIELMSSFLPGSWMAGMPVDPSWSGLLHAWTMEVGAPDGHGQYGVLDEDADGLLCHECGERFAHLGLHAWKRHGLTAAEYRDAHGLARTRGLVVAATREAIVANARRLFPTKTAFVSARDPATALAARQSSGTGMSPAGLAASRARPGRGRLGTVVVCRWCGAAFCPLKGARKRRFCTRSCAGRAIRAAEKDG